MRDEAEGPRSLEAFFPFLTRLTSPIAALPEPRATPL